MCFVIGYNFVFGSHLLNARNLCFIIRNPNSAPSPIYETRQQHHWSRFGAVDSGVLFIYLRELLTLKLITSLYVNFLPRSCNFHAQVSINFKALMHNLNSNLKLVFNLFIKWTSYFIIKLFTKLLLVTYSYEV